MPDDEAPYELSRAALRRRYGSRRIDASAPQSGRDFTPSGRTRYHQTVEGKSKDVAQAESNQEFNTMISGRPLFRSKFANPAEPSVNAMGGGASSFKAESAGFGDAVAIPGNLTALTPGYQPPQPPAPGRPVNSWKDPLSNFAPAPSSEYANPTPLTFNLGAPSPVGASDLAKYLPANPIQQGGWVPPWKRAQATGYLQSILNGGSQFG